MENSVLEENQTNGLAEQSLTHALEALLGGLRPTPPLSTELSKNEDSDLSNLLENKSILSRDSSQLIEIQNENENLGPSAIPYDISKTTFSYIGAENSRNSPIYDEKQISNPDHTISDIGYVDNRTNSVLAQESQKDVTSSSICERKIDHHITEKSEQTTDAMTKLVAKNPVIPGLFLCDINNTNKKPTNLETIPPDFSTSQNFKSNSGISNDGIQEPATETTVITESPTDVEDSNVVVSEEANMEWEADSSPIEDSSDEQDSSENNTSSDDSEAGEDSFKFLSPEEQARILILGDGGSDDEGGDKSKGPEGQLRTKNEIVNEVILKPNVTITQDMPITELGAVEQVVDNILLIKAKISGEYKVLESGSVLCLSDRKVFGAVAETIGRVQQPYYSVLFTDATEIQAEGLSIGTIVYYSEIHSTFVFTKSLKAFKGSDASNINDEEVGEDEVEFSDDEAEAEHRRKIKLKRQEKRGVKIGSNGCLKRGRQSLQKLKEHPDDTSAINYDENDDEPYKTLTRPTGYVGSITRNEGSLEQTNPSEKDKKNNGEKNRSRGRNNRHRSSVNSGRGRGFQNRRGNRASAPRNLPHNPGNDSSIANTTHPNSVPGLYNNLLLPNTPINPYTSAQNSLNMQQFQEYDPRQVQAQQWPNPFLLFYGMNPFNG